MLETILTYLHNWFPVRGAAKTGTFRIVSGVPEIDGLQDGQYYRVQGSVFNDGLHQYGRDMLEDEMFSGTITPLAIPRAVVDISEEIAQWVVDNPTTDKVSESFDGYSYTRSSGASGSTGGWQAAFAGRLAAWRRPCE